MSCLCESSVSDFWSPCSRNTSKCSHAALSWWIEVTVFIYFTDPVCVCVCFSVGVLIAYAANHNISSQIKSTRRFINTNMRDLKTFANNTPAVSPLTCAHIPMKNTQVHVWIFCTALTCNVCFLLQQIEYLTAQYTTAKNKVLSDLDSKLNSDCLHTVFV